MKKPLFALCLSVVIAAGCSGSKSSSGPPYLAGLAVSKQTPIELKCRGTPISATYTFSTEDEFRAVYSGMKDAMANGKEYAPGNGPVYAFQFFENCQIAQGGRDLETWARR
jgi:hypothetical protein